MVAIILWLVEKSGLSKLAVEAIVLGSLAALIFGGWIAVRQHERNIGWKSAIVAVKKQDDRAVAAANKVQQRADECSDNSWWDVISQSCKLEETK